MYRRILVPTDGSIISDHAVQAAIAMAAQTQGAKLYAISVKEPFPYSAISEMQPAPPQAYYDTQQRLANERVSAVVEAAQAHGVVCESFTTESIHPWEAILAHANDCACDLIVMASHGRRGIAALLLGSETQRVLIHSKLPVLVVK